MDCFNVCGTIKGKEFIEYMIIFFLEKMSQNNRRDDIAKSAATVALGAAVGYGCYKLFQLFNSKEEPHTSNPSNHGVIQPRPIPFSSSFPPSFPKDLKIYLIDSMDEFRYAIREIKS